MLLAAGLAVAVVPRLAASLEPSAAPGDSLTDLAERTDPGSDPGPGAEGRAAGSAGDEPADSREDGPEADADAAPDTSATARPETDDGAPGRDRITEEDVPAVAAGTFSVAAPAPSAEAGPEAADDEPPSDEVVEGELTYTVEVEDGLPFSSLAAAATVDRVLGDDRGWETYAGQPLRRTVEAPDFRVLLASPGTTDELCAPLETNGEVSCRNGDLVVLNAVRWAVGVPDYDGRLRQYRTYLVNHEVGHRLGYEHVECPGAGAPAPVMQQQTYGLDGCARNAWPG